MQDATPQNDRANNLRNRLFLARKSVSWVAERVGKSRTWVSLVLNSSAKSEQLLDMIEKEIEELEADNYQLAAAA